VSLLTGLRTEEVRALRWDHVVARLSGQWEPVSEAGFDHEQLVPTTTGPYNKESRQLTSP
jgi:integrase